MNNEVCCSIVVKYEESVWLSDCFSYDLPTTHGSSGEKFSDFDRLLTKRRSLVYNQVDLLSGISPPVEPAAASSIDDWPRTS